MQKRTSVPEDRLRLYERLVAAVEGAELKVLAGGRATLTQPGPMMLMVDIHGGRVKPHEVWSQLIEYGFSVYVKLR